MIYRTATEDAAIAFEEHCREALWQLKGLRDLAGETWHRLEHQFAGINDAEDFAEKLIIRMRQSHAIGFHDGHREAVASFDFPVYREWRMAVVDKDEPPITVGDREFDCVPDAVDHLCDGADAANYPRLGEWDCDEPGKPESLRRKDCHDYALRLHKLLPKELLEGLERRLERESAIVQGWIRKHAVAVIPVDPKLAQVPTESEADALAATTTVIAQPTSEKARSRGRLSNDEREARECAIADYLKKHAPTARVTIRGINSATDIPTGWISANSMTWKAYQKRLKAESGSAARSRATDDLAAVVDTAGNLSRGATIRQAKAAEADLDDQLDRDEALQKLIREQKADNRSDRCDTAV